MNVPTQIFISTQEKLSALEAKATDTNENRTPCASERGDAMSIDMICGINIGIIIAFVFIGIGYFARDLLPKRK